MECSRLGSSIHGISQARILEWVAVFLSRGSSQPWDWTRVYGMVGKFFFIWATREALDSILKSIDITLPKVHRVKTMPFFFFFSNHVWMEKEMATHSSVLAWRIPGAGEPGGLPSMGSHRVGHNWRDLAAATAASIMYGYESWTIKKSELQRIDTLKLWYWRRLLIVFGEQRD